MSFNKGAYKVDNDKESIGKAKSIFFNNLSVKGGGMSNKSYILYLILEIFNIY